MSLMGLLKAAFWFVVAWLAIGIVALPFVVRLLAIVEEEDGEE